MIKFFAILPLLLISCARSPWKSTQDSLRKIPAPATLQDSLQLAPFVDAIQKNIATLETRQDIQNFSFGSQIYTRKEYIEGLKLFIQLYQESPRDFLKNVATHFDFYESYGRDTWGEVFITSYYEPVIPGSRQKTHEMSRPLYALPDDIVEIDLRQFDPEKFAEFNLILRGRILPLTSPRGHKQIVPYLTRAEIDSNPTRLTNTQILCWVKPIDAFFLQIQGSGSIIFDSKEKMWVSYHGQNGHPYRPIGKHLTDVIPIEEMSMQKIESYLASLPPEKAQEILNLNPSYIFFQKSKQPSPTYFGPSAVARRTIATDPSYYPKGTLAYLEYEQPQFDDEISNVPSSHALTAHFVLDQDKGGAIRGPSRVDLFWGSDHQAKRFSGNLKSLGRLLYLAPKRTGI